MFEKIKGTLDKSVAAVSVKSEALVESSRTKTAISNAQKRMDAAAGALGFKMYQAWRAGEVSVDMFQAELQAIYEIEQEIQAAQARLEQIKEEETRILGTQTAKPAATGRVFCTNCGKSLPADSRFCDSCGTPVNQK